MARHLTLAFTVLALVAAADLPAQESGFLGKTAGAWAAQLKSADADQRRKAAYALGKMGTRAVPVLADLKSAANAEKDAQVRNTLLFALAQICRDKRDRDSIVLTDVEPIFLAALDDGDAHVRRSGAVGLGCLASKSEASRKALGAALSDKEAFVRQNAAWALANLGTAGLPLVQKALHDADSLVQRDAAGAMLQVLQQTKDFEKVHALLPDVLPLCKDNNSEVRRAALNVLVWIVDAKDKEAIATLKHALSDQDLENKRNAALALSNIGGPESAAAVPVLTDALRAEDKELRRQAAAAFRNIGPDAAGAVNDLIAALRDDPDAEVRQNAAVSLGGIGKAAEPAIPLLLKKLKDVNEDRTTRVYSATALWPIGSVPKATEIVPELLAFMTDRNQDSEVRLRVSWALRVHNAKLRNLVGTLDAYKKVLNEPLVEMEEFKIVDGRKEPLGKFNKMLRYDAAYMLGMVWNQEAPDETLDRLSEYLRDKDFAKIARGTSSGVGGNSAESTGGKANIQENYDGDGRVMAAEALQMIGARRYGARADIMKALRVIAADKSTYPPLRKKAAELVDAVVP